MAGADDGASHFYRRRAVHDCPCDDCLARRAQSTRRAARAAWAKGYAGTRRISKSPPAPDAPRCFRLQQLEWALGTTTARETGRLLGIRRESVARLRSAGLTWAQADFYAVRAGRHPLTVWPDWLEE